MVAVVCVTSTRGHVALSCHLGSLPTYVCSIDAKVKDLGFVEVCMMHGTSLIFCILSTCHMDMLSTLLFRDLL